MGVLRLAWGATFVVPLFAAAAALGDDLSFYQKVALGAISGALFLIAAALRFAFYVFEKYLQSREALEKTFERLEEDLSSLHWQRRAVARVILFILAIFGFRRTLPPTTTTPGGGGNRLTVTAEATDANFTVRIIIEIVERGKEAMSSILRGIRTAFRALFEASHSSIPQPVARACPRLLTTRSALLFGTILGGLAAPVSAQARATTAQREVQAPVPRPGQFAGFIGADGDQVVQDGVGLHGDLTTTGTAAADFDAYFQAKMALFSDIVERGCFDGCDFVAVDPPRPAARFILTGPQQGGAEVDGIGAMLALPRHRPRQGIRPMTIGDNRIGDDSIGGRAYYLARNELEMPLGESARELGLRPSVFVDVGALWGIRTPVIVNLPPDDPRVVPAVLDDGNNVLCAGNGAEPVAVLPTGFCPAGTTLLPQPFREAVLGDTPVPRVSVGFGVNWNTPFGPFRIDIARALLGEPGDDAKLFTFNVGTAF